MQITNQKTQEVYQTDYTSKNKETEKAGEEFYIEKKESESVKKQDKILDYYNQICDNYPEITFRITDSTQEYEGYKGKSYQKGENYSMPGQCSITFDLAVLQKMKKDANYEEEIKKLIAQIKTLYPSYQANSGKEAGEYIDLCILEYEGVPTYAYGYADHPIEAAEDREDFTQEDESTSSIKDNLTMNVAKARDEIEEAYYKMLDESRKRREELAGINK